MDIKKYVDIVVLGESKRETLEQAEVSYNLSDLDPVMSEDTLKYHYGKLAQGYVDRYNKKEGNDPFNYGGATLHNLFFPQLRTPRSGNRPVGVSKEVIDNKWQDFEQFKDEFSLEFMKAQGSNWIYMDMRGNIKVIHNHEYNRSMEIAMIVDAWEHAWALDYQHDKQKYLDNIWRIIDWTVVNDRITSSKV
jgi:Fe-Mn family superoxide dismutase